MLYQFKIELSDIDRATYASLDFKVAQHPSETAPFLLTRVLAYVLNFQDQLDFSPAGLADPDAPALLKKDLRGETEIWIEIGNTSARKLHKATKSTKTVMVYTYKNVNVLVEEINKNAVHRADEIQIYAIDPQFLNDIEKTLTKNNRWSLLHQQGQIDLGIGEKTFSTTIQRKLLK